MIGVGAIVALCANIAFTATVTAIVAVTLVTGYASELSLAALALTWSEAVTVVPGLAKLAIFVLSADN